MSDSKAARGLWGRSGGGLAGTRKPAGPPSLIAGDIVVRGDFTGEGALQIDCAVHGDVAIAHLFIGKTGSVHGLVTSEVLTVWGKVVGSINAQRVVLHPSAHVEGDIAYDALIIEEGAFFQGRCQPRGAAVVNLPSVLPTPRA